MKGIFMGAKLVLQAESGLQMGSLFKLDPRRTSIGRSLEAHIPVDDTNVSRNHAAIDMVNGHAFVVDLGSTNGTFVNDEKVQERKALRIGDKIRVGGTIFSVSTMKKVSDEGLSVQWREETHIVQRRPEVSIEMVRDELSKRQELWNKLREPRWFKMDRNKKRIAFGIFCIIVVSAAIAVI
jgi:pSer/pThr/pTyr-binding forkhead associated (FHA) protein